MEETKEISEERKLFWIGQSLEKVSDRSKPNPFLKGMFWGLLCSVPAWVIALSLVLKGGLK